MSTEYESYVEAIRRGGFLSFIPVLLTEHGPAPHLAGFPASICYTGLRDHSTSSLSDLVTACYWCDPRSYYEDAAVRRATYQTLEPNEYRVEVTYDKAEGVWQGHKFRGEKLALLSGGRDLKRFIIQTTLRGLNEGEPAQPRLTCNDTASVGVFIFTPTGQKTSKEVSA